MRGRVASVTGFALLAFTATATAQDPPSAELDWDGLEAAGCLPEPLARSEVRSRLERDPFATIATGASFRVSATVRRDTSGLAIVFHMADRDGRSIGERELRSRGRDCRALDRSLVLALALMIESPAARATIHLPASPSEQIEPPRTPPARRPVRARPSGLRARIEVATDAFVGWLAPLSAGASLAVSLGSSAGVSIHVRAHGLTSIGLEEARVDVLALRSEVGACLLGTISERLTAGGCLDAAVMFIHARGHGLGDPRTIETTAPDVVASARAELWLGGTWSIGAELGIDVILVRPRFEVGEGVLREITWEPWPVSPFLRLALLSYVP